MANKIATYEQKTTWWKLEYLRDIAKQFAN